MRGEGVNAITVHGRPLLLVEVGGGAETHMVRQAEGLDAKPAVERDRIDGSIRVCPGRVAIGRGVGSSGLGVERIHLSLDRERRRLADSADHRTAPTALVVVPNSTHGRAGSSADAEPERRSLVGRVAMRAQESDCAKA